MPLLDTARRALARLTGAKPSPAAADERSAGERGRGADGGDARSTQDPSSAPNPSVAAEEVD
jgi:hypothetical protein